jgi:hypothetical protein
MRSTIRASSFDLSSRSHRAFSARPLNERITGPYVKRRFTSVKRSFTVLLRGGPAGSTPNQRPYQRRIATRTGVATFYTWSAFYSNGLEKLGYTRRDIPDETRPHGFLAAFSVSFGLVFGGLRRFLSEV